MKTKYHWTQILVSIHQSVFVLIHKYYRQGVGICIGGLAMLVGSDLLTDKNYPALSKGKGDGFMILGATLYGICECDVYVTEHLESY